MHKNPEKGVLAKILIWFNFFRLAHKSDIF